MFKTYFLVANKKDTWVALRAFRLRVAADKAEQQFVSLAFLPGLAPLAYCACVALAQSPGLPLGPALCEYRHALALRESRLTQSDTYAHCLYRQHYPKGASNALGS
jgi:hypothetical protein